MGLYILHADGKLETAIKKQGIPFQYHDEIGAKAYKIPRFTLYLEAFASVGGPGTRLYSKKPFKLQVSDVMGDFTTPEFDPKDKTIYTYSNSWENTGDIAKNQPSGLRVTQIYFKDYSIRIK